MVKRNKGALSNAYIGINYKAMKKYKFVDRFETAIITIPLVRKTITKDNASDEDIEFLLKKFPGKFDHNFELVSEYKPQKEVEEVVIDERAYPKGKPCMCKEWSVEHLKAYAKDKNIAIGASKKKATIFKKIKEANDA